MQNTTLCNLVTAARKKKGLTQEELASLTNLTVRTIQRIESGATQPRSFTLKAIAGVLEIPFDAFTATEPVCEEQVPPGHPDKVGNTTHHFLQLFCLSCFSYLVIPYLHFLLPRHLLKRQGETPLQCRQFAQQVIRTQLVWTVALHLLLLLTLAYNLLQATYGNRQYIVSYLWIVLGLYLVNAAIIGAAMVRAKRLLLNA